jgi:hypothetical protein
VTVPLSPRGNGKPFLGRIDPRSLLVQLLRE